MYIQPVQIHTIPSRLTIDTTEARAELGRKSTQRVSRETAQAGKQAALEGVERRVQQGRELMRIEDGGQPIVAQAKASQRQMKPLGIAFLPSYGSVKISYTPAKVTFDYPSHDYKS